MGMATRPLHSSLRHSRRHSRLHTSRLHRIRGLVSLTTHRIPADAGGLFSTPTRWKRIGY